MIKERTTVSHIPKPVQGTDGPTYEGRPLARPDDEIVDQGVGFDIATLVTRRRVLSLVGAGVGAAALTACASGGAGNSGTSASTSSTNSSAGSTASGSSGTTDGEIPEETNGPYPADGTNEVNVLEESGIVRRDITSSLHGGSTVEGVPLTMTFTVQDMAGGQAFEGAAVYAWHCDGTGQYSMYTQGVEDETWLRGIQVADANGELSFTTVVPGCYSGRWPHIHFEVYPDVDSATSVENVIATSQVAFPEDILTAVYERDEYAGSAENMAGVGSVEDDGIFADSLDLQLATVTGSIDAGYVATLTVNVDTTTEPSSGGTGGGPSGEGPGGPPPGQGGEPPTGAPPSDVPSTDSN